jgi:hypothetical protein
MLNSGQKQALLLSMVPYLCLALYDGFLHQRARSVSLPEIVSHLVLTLSLASLCAGLFFDYSMLILPALVIFGMAALVDELGFHRTLPKLERRLHFAAYACFAGFVVVALQMGALS